MRIASSRLAAAAVAAGLVYSGSSVLAAPIASDSYTIGASPAAGQYSGGQPIASQPGLVTSGFANNGYTGGAGTSNFQAAAGGLSTNLFAGGGGQVNWLGLSSGDPQQVRSNARNLSAGQNLATYYTSTILRRGTNGNTAGDVAPAVNSFVGTGYANTPAPATAATTALTGFYVGFAGTNGTTDYGSLVIRIRDTTATTNADYVLVSGIAPAVGANATAGTTFEVVTKSTGGAGQDSLTYWVNPTDVSSEAAMTGSSLVTGTIANYSMQLGGSGSADLLRLNYAAVGGGTGSTGNFVGTAAFDETRLGTALIDVVPEPASLAAIAGAGVTLFRRRRER